KLRHAARTAIKEGDLQPWFDVWFSVTPETRTDVWTPTIRKGKRIDLPDGENGKPRWNFERPCPPFTGAFVSMDAYWVRMIGPHPTKALLRVIDAAIKRRQGASRQRQRDELVVDLRRVIKNAAKALLPKDMPAKQRNKKTRALALDIDRHFQLGI